MRRMVFCIAAFLLLTMTQQIGNGQPDAWERVRLIEPGKKVNIVLTGGKSIRGKMQTWTPEGITLLQGSARVVHLAKAEILKLSFAAGMPRSHRAAWAGGIGGGIGAGLMTGLCAGAGECDASPAAMAGWSAVLFGGVAAGIAALIPQHHEVVYRAAPVRSRVGPADSAVASYPLANSR